MLIDKINKSIQKLKHRQNLTEYDKLLIGLFLGSIGKSYLNYNDMYVEIQDRIIQMSGSNNNFTILSDDPDEDCVIGDLKVYKINNKITKEVKTILILGSIQLLVSTELLPMKAVSPLDAIFKLNNKKRIYDILNNSINNFVSVSSNNVINSYNELLNLTVPVDTIYEDLIISTGDEFFCIYNTEDECTKIKYITDNLIKDLENLDFIKSLFI